jgi:hypothetical protein
MKMSIKSPIKMYLLMWITCSIYGFIWAFKVMESINQLKGTEHFKTRIIFKGIITFITVDLLLFSLAIKFFWILPIVFILHVAWLVFVFTGIKIIAKQIRFIEEDLGFEDTISEGSALFLMFLYFTSIIYIQRHLNKIILIKNNADNSEIKNSLEV